MKYANQDNTEVGDTVLVPLQGEFMHDEQICIEYEVVVALRAKTKPDKQVVGTNQEPLPEWMPFNDDIAYQLEQ